MSGGQKAAEDTKSTFSEGFQATEDLRKNINSYADNLLTNNQAKSSTGIHPDAKETGSELGKGVENVGRKMEEMANKNHQK